MGYTHYWKNTGAPIPSEAFGRTAVDARKIVGWASENGIKLANAVGAPGTEPEFTEGFISLNGEEPDEYETFYFEAVPDDFTFCKTVRNAYDIVVCAVLLRAQKHYGASLHVSSDGEWDVDDEWQPARQLVAELFAEVAEQPEGLR